VIVVRVAVGVALLAAVYLGSRLALVGLLTWILVKTELLRRELFQQQEEDALARIREYWNDLTKGGS